MRSSGSEDSGASADFWRVSASYRNELVSIASSFLQFVSNIGYMLNIWWFLDVSTANVNFYRQRSLNIMASLPFSKTTPTLEEQPLDQPTFLN